MDFSLFQESVECRFKALYQSRHDSKQSNQLHHQE